MGTKSLYLLMMGFMVLVAFIVLFTQLGAMTTFSQAGARGEVSQSKLGIVLLSDSPEARTILASGPKILNVYEPFANQITIDLMRQYKKMYPSGIIVVRFNEGNTRSFTIADDPSASADEFWNTVLAPKLAHIPSTDASLISYVSGPVAFTNTPPLNTAEEARWTASFWIELSNKISAAGFKPNLGEIPVGNPDVNNLDAIIPPLIPALQKIKSVGGVWSSHGYTTVYGTNINEEMWTSLRYRKIYSYFAAQYPNMISMPLLLTEAGVDMGGDSKKDGWRARGDAQKFEEWLSWYDSEIKKDSYVVGAAIFQAGDNVLWTSFSIDPIAGWLAGYLGGTPFDVTPITPPTQLDPTLPVQPRNDSIHGVMDTIGSDGEAMGWAIDTDTPDQKMQVHFFVDGPVGVGKAAGIVMTDTDRPDINQAYNTSGTHGFTWSIPNEFRDGKTHFLYVHAIDTSGNGPNILIGGVPKKFNISSVSGSGGSTPQASVTPIKPTLTPTPKRTTPADIRMMGIKLGQFKQGQPTESLLHVILRILFK